MQDIDRVTEPRRTALHFLLSSSEQHFFIVTMLWGLTIHPGEEWTREIHSKEHLTLAALECRPGKNNGESNPSSCLLLKIDDSEHVLCTLEKGHIPQQKLDLVLQQTVTFTVQGTGAVYLTGYSVDPLQNGRVFEIQPGMNICDSEGDVDETLAIKEEYVSTMVDNSPVSNELPATAQAADHERNACLPQVNESTCGDSHIDTSAASELPYMAYNSLLYTSSHPNASFCIAPDRPEQRNLETLAAVCEMDGLISPEGNVDAQETSSQPPAQDDHVDAAAAEHVPATKDISTLGEIRNQPQEMNGENADNAAGHSVGESQETSTNPNNDGDIDATPDISIHHSEEDLTSEETRNESETRHLNSENVEIPTANSVCDTNETIIDKREASQPSNESKMTSVTSTGKSSRILRPRVRNSQGDHQPKNKSTKAPVASLSSKACSKNNVSVNRKQKVGHLKCCYCGETFHRMDMLRNHEKRHNLAKCKYCHRTFSQMVHLLHHLRTHTGEKPFKCRYCSKEFDHMDNFHLHEKTHDRKKVIQCQYCDKKFGDSSSAIRHRRTHTGEKPYNCQYCKEKFVQRGQVKRHERIHTGEKPFKCQFCGEIFRQKAHVQRHERTHTGERPYQCRYCERAFSALHTARSHERTHTGEKPFKCKSCSKAFADSSNLKSHERIHTT